MLIKHLRHMFGTAGAGKNHIRPMFFIMTKTVGCIRYTDSTAFVHKETERVIHVEFSRIDTKLEATLAPLNIQLALCCERETLQELPEDSTIGPSACISGDNVSNC